MELDAKYLEQENNELKLMNLQYQGWVRTLTANNRKVAGEIQELKNENKALTEKLNHLTEEMSYLASRANQTSIARSAKSEPFSGFEATPSKNTDTAAKLTHLEKKVERFKGMYETWKEAFRKLEKEKTELEQKHNELRHQNAPSQDPRVQNRILLDLDNRVKELTKVNTELQARLDADHEASAVNLNCIKQERIGPEADLDKPN